MMESALIPLVPGNMYLSIGCHPGKGLEGLHAVIGCKNRVVNGLDDGRIGNAAVSIIQIGIDLHKGDFGGMTGIFSPILPDDIGLAVTGHTDRLAHGIKVVIGG